MFPQLLLTVVVAGPERMAMLRDGLPTPGRILRYPTSNLASAFESIRASRPGLIVLDSAFAGTAEGQGFVARVTELSIPKLVLQQAVFDRGHWTMTPLDATLPGTQAGASARELAVTATGIDTRRAPRYPAQDIARAVADGTPIEIVDLSVLGAQMISAPMVKPNQRIRVGLPAASGTIQLAANVAWSTYEKPAKAGQPHFRIGVEFADAEEDVLAEYCRRHCRPDPVPIRR